MKFTQIHRRVLKEYSDIITKDVEASAKEMGVESYKKCVEIINTNLPIFKEKLANVRHHIWCRAKLASATSCTFEISKLFDSEQVRTGISFVGVQWIINQLNKAGYEAYTTTNIIDLHDNSCVTSYLAEIIHISWNYTYPLFLWVKTPFGRKVLWWWIMAIGVFSWLNLVSYLQGYFDQLHGLSCVWYSFGKIDSTFILGMAAAWLAMHIPSYLEQVAQYNTAFGNKSKL